MTQTERLYDYLINHKSIGPMEALNELGIYRLASRIHDLNKEHRVEKEMVTITNRFGEEVRVAEYFLECDCPVCKMEGELCRH